MVSIGLNIWLIGFALGNKADEYRVEHKNKGSRFERRVEMLTRNLSPATQKEFMTKMKDYSPDVESDFWKKLEDLNSKLGESIKGENVDVERAREIFSEIRRTMAQTHTEFQEGFLKAVQGLSREDRETIAEALKESRKPF